MDNEMMRIIPFILGGLALFLHAIARLSRLLRSLLSVRAKRMIATSTGNLLKSIGVGLILTILMDSSSALIILVIIFINSEALSFRQAIGLILGANIGTTFSSQIIALDIGQFAVIPLLAGLIVILLSKSERVKSYGKLAFYFGMVFFGLYMIQESVHPLEKTGVFKSWILTIENNYLYGSMIGGLITLIIQSSSGTVGMAIVLCKQHLLNLSGGIALMLGAELGTCADTLVATIGGKRQALKAGLFHLVFNISTIGLGLLFFPSFVRLVELVSFDADSGTQIANGHMLFNIMGVLIMLPFVRPMEKLFNYFLPESGPADLKTK